MFKLPKDQKNELIQWKMINNEIGSEINGMTGPPVDMSIG